jgi:hypothetical protein
LFRFHSLETLIAVSLVVSGELELFLKIKQRLLRWRGRTAANEMNTAIPD